MNVDVLQNMKRIWTFYLKAQTKYDIHSPYISNLIEGLMAPLGKDDLTKIQAAENERSKLLEDQRKITMEPMGAGSRLKDNDEITIRQLAARSLSTPRQCALYFRLIKWLQPTTILELGTSLGISTLYHHLAAPNAHLVSIEGRRCIHKFAQEMFAKNQAGKNVELLPGLFDDHLSRVLTSFVKVDYVFIDGDHKGSALMRYIQQILPYTHDKSIIVLHDIYWSDDMMLAWREIVTWPQIRASLDTYDMGILLFNPSILHKQNINLVSTWLKPWRQGFF